MSLDLPDLHRRALAATRPIVEGIDGGQLDDDTPCDGMDVRALLTHVVYGNLWVAPLVEGRTIEEVGDRFEGDVLDGDPVAAYDASAESAASAFEGPGAMQAPVAVSYGPVPGEVYAGHRFLDVLVHGWDLAVATGRDTALDPELVAALWDVVQPQAEGLKASGAFGTEVPVPDDAPLQDRLLGLLGRTPR
jgi:uncharacterized protein (TIGR03086 family)